MLRDQIDRWTETFSGIALSAEDRFLDAQRLLVAGRYRGAVYLLGLAGEMWLKLACYRLLGAVASDPVGPHARSVRTFLTLHVRMTDQQWESGHNLLCWTEFIVLKRGPLLSRQQAGFLRHHIVNRLYMDWKIQLRYRPVPVSAEHARRALSDAAWLRDHWDKLTR